MMSEARSDSAASTETNNSRLAAGGNAVSKPVRKKPAPFLDDPFLGSSSNEPSLSASIATSAGSSALLSSRASAASDNPYLRDFLVDLSSSGSSHDPRSTTASSNIAVNIESASDPFSDPEDPFADPRNNKRLSTHSRNSDLSYASLTPSQADRSMDDTNSLARHVSMKSGLSYASLTPSQVQRRLDYVSPGPSSDTSSDIRLSTQSGTSITSTTSVATVTTAEQKNGRDLTPSMRTSAGASIHVSDSFY